MWGGVIMSDVIFDGKLVTLYDAEDHEQNQGIIVAINNVHVFLDLEVTSELISGLNQVAYKLFQTRSEIYQ